MAVTLIGKIIITIALCSQAYLMAMDTTAINEFTSNAKKVIPKSLGIENIVGYLHFVVAGLLATSILMTVFKNCFFKVTVLLALVALLVIENSTLLTTLPSIKEE